jgi:hypothetical protein
MIPLQYQKKEEVFMIQKDTSWIRPGISIRVGKLTQYADPTSLLIFSKSDGATGSVINIDGDYAIIYIATNITCGKPPQERVPLVQCEKV